VRSGATSEIGTASGNELCTEAAAFETFLTVTASPPGRGASPARRGDVATWRRGDVAHAGVLQENVELLAADMPEPQRVQDHVRTGTPSSSCV
jgi:hypothetical protein